MGRVIRFFISAFFLNAFWAGFVQTSTAFASNSAPFPKEFKWCVATAAYQIEGNNIHSDWWEAENSARNENAGTVAPFIRRAQRSGVATDHWNRIDDDVRLLKDLGVQSYRFSLEWARLEPQNGVWDEAAFEHYDKEIDHLLAAGIEPWVTIHHFTHPAWFMRLGGWASDSSVTYFERFVEKVIHRWGNKIKTWITFNEPNVLLNAQYVGGMFPPFLTLKLHRDESLKSLKSAVINIYKSHASAYRLIHSHKTSKKKKPRVGQAVHLRVFEPWNRFSPYEWLIANRFLDDYFNWSFLDAPETGRISLNMPFLLNIDEAIEGLKGTQDFIGFNYYSRDLVKTNWDPNEPFRLLPHPQGDLTGMGFEVYPKGFEIVLSKLKTKYTGREFLVLENGLDDPEDSKRQKFLVDHLAILQKFSTQEGMNISGYCHWTLMDNFEWIWGFDPKMGLYETNFETFERTPRPSALLYEQIVRTNAL
ncbi:MAG: hypothetical protein COT74_11745 [Bdellovibrionales bacterium CG10_big_fil_rev_8_21_14_0_10_45_34]|nr:MAG: hypothetical protein COT74_11745 [Bdellovibrionales bacterium CG10_big_fil_rev_8_21_14_0_10_45_34]